MRVRTLFTLLFLVLLLTAFFHQGLAQTAGKLAGTVTDETGEPLIFANILIDGTTMGAATDVEGHYIILNVRPGVYTLRFQFIGYTTKIVENVRVSGDQTKTLDVVLTKEVIKGEEVIVVAKKPLVEFNQTSSVSSVNKDDIKSLPVQNLNEIVNLQAGVVDGHFRGGRIGEVQYQIDGVTVNNPFNNASMLSIDKSIIEEVQVISGTFDAKYGQAMSGVVNAVLRTGSDRFEISGEAYLGDYYATDTKRYPRIDEINPLGIRNVQLSLSGPTGIPQTTFFLSGRAYWSDGWMSGIRRFTPFDSSDFEKRIFLPTGDNEVVPMNTMKDFSGQAKITNQSIRDFQIFYQATLNYSDAKSYNHSFRLNPDGTLNNYTTSLAHGLGITHTLSPVMFYKLNFRHNYFLYESYKYKELEDPRYLQAADPKGDANYEDGAIVQGVDLGRYRQSTSSFIAKGDFTWQLNRINMIEAGLEAQVSEIVFGPPGFFVSTTIDGVQVLKPVYQYPKQPGLQTYHPSQGAAYIQDRVELGDLVVRAGLRFEFFNANSRIPSDFQNPANAISGAPKSTLVETKVKYAVAPRLGFSFPLTTTASVYFSYGHFYQLPGLGLLYGNADYSILEDLQAGGISYGVMGNPDLKPELTIQYEFGLKQSIAEILGTQLSFFYKDIRDLLGVEFVSTYAAADYGKFTNVDFGSVYGVTLSLFQRNIGNLNSSVDYTLQFAQGNSSDPRETANRAAAGQDPRPRDLPFSWDQRHTLNFTVVYAEPENYAFSLIGRYGSGQPYTPVIGSGFGASQEVNSGRKNNYFLLDARAEKYFDIGFAGFSVFMRVFNVLNTSYVNGFVFSSTGSPDYTLTPSESRAALYDPSRYYEPRRIEIGISFRSL